MIKQFGWVVIGRVLAALLQFVGLALLVNWISPSEFGVVVAAIGISVVPLAFLDFGITTFTLKTWGDVSQRRQVIHALKFSNKVCIGFGICITLAMVVSGLFWIPTALWLAPLAIWAAAERNADTWMSVAIAQGRSHLSTANLVSRRILSIIVMLTCMEATNNGVLSYGLGLAIASLASVAFVHMIFRKEVGRYASSGELKTVLRAARPFWLHSFATQVRNLDTFLVVTLASPVQAGYYGLASRLSGPLRLIPTSVAPALIPQVVRYGLSKKIVAFIIVLLAALAFGYLLIAAFADDWVPALFGSAYLASVEAVRVTCLGLILGATASITSAALQALGRQVLVARTSILASLVCVPAISFGSVQAGALGAAYGMASSFVVQACVFVAALIFHAKKPGTS